MGNKVPMRVVLTKRKECTAKNPFTEERDRDEPGYKWEHDDVEEVGGQKDGWPGGDIQRYWCRNCGVTWKAELPQ